MVWLCALSSAMTSKKDVKTTLLRQRMIDQMRIAGLSRNTQASYVCEIKCLAKAFNMRGRRHFAEIRRHHETMPPGELLARSPGGTHPLNID